MAEVAALETLFDAQVLAVPGAPRIQPAHIVEAQRVHHQRVALPAADRVSEPGWRWIRRVLPPIGEDLAEDGLHFIEEKNFARRLDDLEGLGEQISMRHAIGQTMQVGPHDSGLRMLPDELAAKRRQWFFALFEIGKDVPEVFRIGRFAQSE